MTTLVNLYKTRIPHSRFVFRDGTVANFIGDQFLTDNPNHIAELDNEIRLKHPTIYQVAGQEQIDPKQLDPVEVFKAKVICEFLTQVANASGDPSRDMGSTEKQLFQKAVANSRSIAPVAAGGDGVSTFNVPKSTELSTAIPEITTDKNMPAALANALGLLNSAETNQGAVGVVPQGKTAAEIEDEKDAAAGLAALSVFKNTNTQ